MLQPVPSATRCRTASGPATEPDLCAGQIIAPGKQLARPRWRSAGPPSRRKTIPNRRGGSKHWIKVKNRKNPAMSRVNGGVCVNWNLRRRMRLSGNGQAVPRTGPRDGHRPRNRRWLGQCAVRPAVGEVSVLAGANRADVARRGLFRGDIGTGRAGARPRRRKPERRYIAPRAGAKDESG